MPVWFTPKLDNIWFSPSDGLPKECKREAGCTLLTKTSRGGEGRGKVDGFSSTAAYSYPHISISESIAREEALQPKSVTEGPKTRKNEALTLLQVSRHHTKAQGILKLAFHVRLPTNGIKKKRKKKESKPMLTWGR